MPSDTFDDNESFSSIDDRSINWFYGTISREREDDRPPVRSQDSFNAAERGQVVIPQPEVIQNYLYPITVSNKLKIVEYRSLIDLMLSSQCCNDSSPLLVITGPKFITNPTQAKFCAQWISVLSGKRTYRVENEINPIHRIYTKNKPISNQDLMISMRANLNKLNFDYNVTYKHDLKPSLMSYEIGNGIPICRALLCELCQYCPLVGQLSDTVTPQYISDLFCLGIVESSLTESQLHRELVSGISYPVGFHTEVEDPKLLEFKIDSAIDAIMSSSHAHHFLSITKLGIVSIVGTIGNNSTFIILSLSNVSSIIEANLLFEKVMTKLKCKNIVPRIMIDIGKVNSSNYEIRYKLLEEFLSNDEICLNLIGFMIDSGEDYFDESMGLQENDPRMKNPYVTFEFNNLKSKMDKPGIADKINYDTLEHTDKLIHKLVALAKYRKGLIREVGSF